MAIPVSNGPVMPQPGEIPVAAEPKILVNITFPTITGRGGRSAQHPILNFCSGSDDKYPFSFGVGKASVLLKYEKQNPGGLGAALQEFIDRYGPNTQGRK